MNFRVRKIQSMLFGTVALIFEYVSYRLPLMS